MQARVDPMEEITQETFVRSMKQIGQVDGNVKSWLLTISRNTYYRYCRRRQIYSQEEQPDLKDSLNRGKNHSQTRIPQAACHTAKAKSYHSKSHIIG